MERRTTSWFSPNLQMEMPLVALPIALSITVPLRLHARYDRIWCTGELRREIEGGGGFS